MIKIGIAGADSEKAGELLRLLILHPEADIKVLFAPGNAGRSVSGIHHGFIGENMIGFSDSIDPSSLDLLFIIETFETLNNLFKNGISSDNLKVIDLSDDRFENPNKENFDYGLSEINRKTLVRTARFTRIPTPAAAMVLISLFPLARFLMLPSSIDISISAPNDIIASVDKDKLSKEIISNLRDIQNSFSGNLNFEMVVNNTERVIRTSCRLKCSMSEKEIENLFIETYDDHNFTFITTGPFSDKEVEGTQKTIIKIKKTSPEVLEINAIGDCRMRGGAGDAVHVMNLLFALYEKIGLHLKPEPYFRENNLENNHDILFG